MYGRPQTSAHLDQPGGSRCGPPSVSRCGRRDRRRVQDPAGQPRHQRARAVDACGCRCPDDRTAGREPRRRVPGAGIVFAGAMCTFGVTPLAHQGDPGGVGRLARRSPRARARSSCPVTVRSAARKKFVTCSSTSGRASTPTVTSARLGTGPWDGWTARDHDAVNVERAAMLRRGDDAIPDALWRIVAPLMQSRRPSLLAAASPSSLCSPPARPTVRSRPRPLRRRPPSTVDRPAAEGLPAFYGIPDPLPAGKPGDDHQDRAGVRAGAPRDDPAGHVPLAVDPGEGHPRHRPHRGAQHATARRRLSRHLVGARHDRHRRRVRALAAAG